MSCDSGEGCNNLKSVIMNDRQKVTTTRDQKNIIDLSAHSRLKLIFRVTVSMQAENPHRLIDWIVFKAVSEYFGHLTAATLIDN